MRSTKPRHVTLGMLFVCLAPTLASSLATASEAKTLHQKHCQRCHDDSIYTRQDPLVLSYSALKQRVKLCDGVAGSHMPEKQLQSVIDYLNERYYKFQRK